VFVVFPAMVGGREGKQTVEGRWRRAADILMLMCDG
jgi:hypothetical protein